LLFQDVDGGRLADAIETVTIGYDHTRLSHVAMVVPAGDGPPQVVEAIGAGVVVTPLNKFLARSCDAEGRPKVLVGRLREDYRPLIPGAIEFALSQRGKPYAKLFGMDGNSYYCSSLLYDAFLHANRQRPLFTTAPMTFKDPATGDFFPAWRTYFAELNVPIPEGKPGINPGGMSRADCVQIVYAFGHVSRRQ
jgi:hypothetical protein